MSNLTPDEIAKLSCEYFERCACGYEDQTPKNSEKKKALKDVLTLLDIKIPIPCFGL